MAGVRGLVHPADSLTRGHTPIQGQVCGGGKGGQVTTGLADDDFGGALPDPGNAIQVGQILISVTQQLGDALVELNHQAGQVIDLVQEVATHERVMVGERPIQGSTRRSWYVLSRR